MVEIHGMLQGAPWKKIFIACNLLCYMEVTQMSERKPAILRRAERAMATVMYGVKLMEKRTEKNKKELTEMLGLDAPIEMVTNAAIW